MQDWKDALASLRPDESDAATPQDSGSGSPAADDSPALRKLPRLQIFYEKKGRAGKPATIICGLDPLPDDEIADIARRLKQKMGCGGSARGGEILLQGDRREQARQLLNELGFKI